MAWAMVAQMVETMVESMAAMKVARTVLRMGALMVEGMGKMMVGVWVVTMANM